MFNVLNFIGNKKGKAGIFMKISKKLTIMLFGILLIGCVLNGAVKRKNPVINDKRRELVFKKFNCNKKIWKKYFLSFSQVMQFFIQKIAINQFSSLNL